MLKIILQLFKVIGLMLVMMVLNPHRVVLIVTFLLAAIGSWFAGKLEALCQWLADWTQEAKVKFWLFGKPLQKVLDREMDELDKRVKKVEKEIDNV